MRLDLTLQDIQRALSLCIKCSMCTYGEWPNNRSLCHMFDEKKFFTYSGGGGLYLARALVQGLMEPTPTMVDVAFRCNTCGNCERICEVVKVPPPHVSPEDVLRLLRAHLVKSGLHPPQGLEKAAISTLAEGNPFGLPRSKRYEPKGISSQGKVALHLGCAPAYRDQRLVDMVLKLLKKTGQEVALIPEEACCGMPLFDAGMWDGLPEAAAKNLERMALTGADTVVFLCPHCYMAYAREYADWVPEGTGGTFNYLHISSFLSHIAGLDKLLKAPKRRKAVTFLDPCYLSRVMGEHDVPRRVIQSIPNVELTEMDGSGPDAACCGAGGSVDFSFPESAARCAGNRLDAALATGVDTLLTSCPHCKALLKRTGSDSPKPLEILDIVEFMVKYLA